MQYFKVKLLISVCKKGKKCNPECKEEVWEDTKIKSLKKVRGNCWIQTTGGLLGLGSISRYRKQCEGEADIKMKWGCIAVQEAMLRRDSFVGCKPLNGT